MRLTRVDLPTFGRPTTATTGSGAGELAVVVEAPLRLEEGAVLVVELELLEPGPQGALDGFGVLGLGGVLRTHPAIVSHREGCR